MFPTVVISLDFELAWGSCDVASARKNQQAGLAARESIVPWLLGQLEELSLPATWATVGALMLDGLRKDMRRWPRPVCGADPLGRAAASNESRAWFAPDLVEQLLGVGGQEVALHGFSHVVLDEQVVGRERAEFEFRACAEEGRALGIEPTSFVFPRNRVGYLDLLAKAGFVGYRAPDAIPAGLSGWLSRRQALLAADAVARCPRIVRPARHHGVVALPGSLMLRSLVGWRSLLPLALRRTRLQRGVAACQQAAGILHVWFHPIDLARSPQMVELVGEFLLSLSQAREAGQLQVKTMGEVIAAVGLSEDPEARLIT